MDLRNQAALVAFNRGMAAVVAELIESYENQDIPHNEAVALAAAWQASYLRLVYGHSHQGTDPQGT